MNGAFIQILKVGNFPRFKSAPDLKYRAYVKILPKDEGSFGNLNLVQISEGNNNERKIKEYLKSPVTWNFQYEDASVSSIAFAFYVGDVQFAILKLPLSWFQKNTVVKYTYPALLLLQIPNAKKIMVKIAVHLSENNEAAFSAPKGRLLVSPAWTITNSKKKDDYQTERIIPKKVYYIKNGQQPQLIQNPQQINQLIGQPLQNVRPNVQIQQLQNVPPQVQIQNRQTVPPNAQVRPPIPAQQAVPPNIQYQIPPPSNQFVPPGTQIPVNPYKIPNQNPVQKAPPQIQYPANSAANKLADHLELAQHNDEDSSDFDDFIPPVDLKPSNQPIQRQPQQFQPQPNQPQQIQQQPIQQQFQPQPPPNYQQFQYQQPFYPYQYYQPSYPFYPPQQVQFQPQSAVPSVVETSQQQFCQYAPVYAQPYQYPPYPQPVQYMCAPPCPQQPVQACQQPQKVAKKQKKLSQQQNLNQQQLNQQQLNQQQSIQQQLNQQQLNQQQLNQQQSIQQKNLSQAAVESMPPQTPARVVLPPSVGFEPSKETEKRLQAARDQQQQTEKKKVKKSVKASKTKKAQQLGSGDSAGQVSVDQTLESTSMLDQSGGPTLDDANGFGFEDGEAAAAEQPQNEQPPIEQPQNEQPPIEQPQNEQPQIEQTAIQQPEKKKAKASQTAARKKKAKQLSNNGSLQISVDHSTESTSMLEQDPIQAVNGENGLGFVDADNENENVEMQQKEDENKQIEEEKNEENLNEIGENPPNQEIANDQQ